MLLLDLCFGAVLAGGLRAPGAHAAAAAFLWSLALVHPPDLGKLPGARLWGAWLAWSFLSALASSEPLLSVAAWTYPATAVLFFAMAGTYWKEEERRLWLTFAAAAGAAVCLAAFLIRDPSRPMIGILFPYYNYTAAFAAAVLAALIGAWSEGRLRISGRSLLPCSALGALCLAEILASRSRGALLAAFLAAAYALWSAGKRRTAAALLGVAAAGILLLPNGVLAARLKLAHGGAYVRPAIWRSALSSAADAPWLGVGPGRFGRAFLKRQVPAPEGHRPTRYGIHTRHAHSEFLQAAAETGWPGLLLLLAALAAALFPRRAPLAPLPARACAAALLLTACWDNVFALPAILWFLFSALGLRPPSEEKTGRGSPLPRPALALGLLAAAFAWWPEWSVRRLREEAFDSRGEASLSKMRSALSRASADPDLWSDMGYLYLREGRPARALAALLEAESLHPTSAVHAMRAGEVLLAAGNFAGALDKARRALTLEPVCPQARLIAAEAYLGLGKIEPARREAREAEASAADAQFDPGYDSLVRGLDRARLGRLKEKLSLKT